MASNIGKLAIVTLMITLLVVSYYDYYRLPNMKDVFLQGSPPVHLNFFVDRSKEYDMIYKILQPQGNEKSYYLITGEHGTGKTVLLRSAAFHSGAGVLYMSVPKETKLFGRKLGETVGFYFDEDINLFRTLFQLLRLTISPTDIKSDLDPNLSRMLPFLERVALEFRNQMQRPLILIIDDVNLLAQDAPKVLTLLQDKAKEWADLDMLTLVFVSSEGLATHILQSRSSKSRMAAPIEIGDLSDEVATKYLVERLGNLITREDAAEAVKSVFGGRFSDLIEAARILKSGKSFAEAKKYCIGKSAENFHALKIKCIDFIDLVWNKIDLILNSTSKKISFDEFTHSIETEFQNLLSFGVFSYHPETKYVSLSSRSMEAFLQQRIQSGQAARDLKSMHQGRQYKLAKGKIKDI